MLTVGSIITGKVIDVDFKGQGVIKSDGYVIFAPRLLYGEVVRLKIKKIKKSFCEAEVLEIIEKSKDRTKDFVNLDALDLYHNDIKKQHQWQIDITQQTLSKIADINIDINDIIHDERDRYYRNKSVFHVLSDDALRLGLYDVSKENLIEIDHFVLSDLVTNKFLKILYDEPFCVVRNKLKHVVFRTNQKGQILISFVSNHPSVKGLDAVIERLKKEPEVVGITLNINDSNKHILGRDSIELYKENVIIERLNSIDIPINDRSFFQVNLPVIKKAYQIIKDDMKDKDVVLDAYSGIGSIGYYIVDKVSKVIMVESNEQSVSLANQIKEKYHIEKVDIYRQQTERFHEDIVFNKVIVDPPRNGLMPAFIDYLIERKPETIYYLSCDVKTLSRDLGLIKDMYDVSKVFPIRLFPHTTSLETLVIMNIKK
jgi:23S rRNA (uracil1939-C5)-methyltransferase